MKRIAVVEDNPDNRLLVRAILRDRFELTEYETGDAALEGLKEEIPDLVLLDISLPGIDGTDILRQLKQEPRWAKIPAIALTAHAMAGDRERLLAMGFDDYVAKPILDPQGFIQQIERLLER